MVCYNSQMVDHEARAASIEAFCDLFLQVHEGRFSIAGSGRWQEVEEGELPSRVWGKAGARWSAMILAHHLAKEDPRSGEEIKKIIFRNWGMQQVLLRLRQRLVEQQSSQP